MTTTRQILYRMRLGGGLSGCLVVRVPSYPAFFWGVVTGGTRSSRGHRTDTHSPITTLGPEPRSRGSHAGRAGTFTDVSTHVALAPQGLFHPWRHTRMQQGGVHGDPQPLCAFSCGTATLHDSTSCQPGITPGVPHIHRVVSLVARPTGGNAAM